ncbi:14006_t:CDS:10 [Acaulospora colombiana]|uniref:14006_t:CDS:1 n=1 Tax=Acaulospora colombiana TaxID=27376 RepID=A0ACA9KZ72_9GLOM|nr:14006_t:CDS:10 [Acaulospora colombiana]
MTSSGQEETLKLTSITIMDSHIDKVEVPPASVSIRNRNLNQGSTRIYLSLKRETDEGKKKTKSAQANEEERKDIEVREVDVGSVNNNDQQDAELDLDGQDLEDSSYHSHKVIGKRAERDFSEEPAEKDADQYDSSDKHSHARKRSKRHSSVIVSENDEVNEDKQSHGDSTKPHALEKSFANSSIGAQPVVIKTEHSLSTGEVSEKNIKDSKLGKNSIFYDKNQDVVQANVGGYDGGSVSHDRKETPASEVLIPAYRLRGNRSYPSVTEESKPRLVEARSKKLPKIVQSTQDDAIVVISPPKISELSKPEVVITPLQSDVEVGINNNVNVAEEAASSFQSTGKKGPARRLGRPPKSQGAQQKSTKRTWTWQKKKKDLRTILCKLLDSFNKKDAYGFFAEPVDTTVVTDYLTIIQNPMDFGTMRKKIDCNKYASIDEFKGDFSLVCNNCKTYNAPDTIYYKSADKLWQFGEKAIERERDSILLEEEKQKASEAADTGSKKDAMYGSTPSRASSVRQPRRSKKVDPRKLFYPDGSVIPFGDPSSLIPRPPSFGETPLLTVISSKAQRPARFEDYGPYATLGIDPPFFTATDKNFLYSTYGDEKGYAYAKSIKSFVEDMGDEMNQQVDHFLDKLTRGAHSIDQQVARMMSTTDNNTSFDTSVVTPTELGPVNVGQELNRIRKISELRRQQSELEIWKKTKIDVDFLVSDQEVHTTIQNMGNGQHNLQEIFDLNSKDLAELINIKQSGQSKSNKTEEQITEDLNKRFIQLVQHAPESEKISRTITASQSLLVNSMSNQQPFSLGNLPTPTSLQQLNLSQINTSSHIFTGVDHTDPISALAPSSMLHEAMQL